MLPTMESGIAVSTEKQPVNYFIINIQTKVQPFRF